MRFYKLHKLLPIPDITFLGEFFKAVKCAKESPSTITQPIPDLAEIKYNEFRIYRTRDITIQPKSDLTQTGYNEFRILRIPDIAFLVVKTGVCSELCEFFSNLFLSKPSFNAYKKPKVLRA